MSLFPSKFPAYLRVVPRDGPAVPSMAPDGVSAQSLREAGFTPCVVSALDAKNKILGRVSLAADGSKTSPALQRAATAAAAAAAAAEREALALANEIAARDAASLSVVRARLYDAKGAIRMPCPMHDICSMNDDGTIGMGTDCEQFGVCLRPELIEERLRVLGEGVGLTVPVSGLLTLHLDGQPPNRLVRLRAESLAHSRSNWPGRRR